MATYDFYSPLFTYRYTATFRSILNGQFAVSIPSRFTSYITSSYIYTGEDVTITGKLIGHRSDYTQLIANGFQDWNRIRNCQDSTGQFFINSIAISLEDVHEYWNKRKKELWIDTADKYEPWKIDRIGIPSYVDINNTQSPQLLHNSNFREITVARSEVPAGWTTLNSDDTVSIDHSDSLLGGPCIKFDGRVGTLSYIGQSQDIVASKNEQFTFSVWYKNFEDSSFDAYADGTPQLKVSVLYGDSTTETFTSYLSNSTNGEWIRGYITFSGTYDIGRITAGVILHHTGYYYDREYYFDGFQLEKNNKPTPWMPALTDVPEFIKIHGQFYQPLMTVEAWQDNGFNYGTISDFYCSGNLMTNTPVYYIVDGRMLLSRELVPTRISVSGTNEVIAAYSNNIFGLFVNNIDPPSEKGWTIRENKLLEYAWPSTIDTGRLLSLREPGIDKQPIKLQSAINQFDLFYSYSNPSEDSAILANGYDIDYNDLTIKNGYIWLACKETYKDESYNVLKIINPKTEYNKDYVEVIKDFKIPMSGNITDIGFIDSDPPQIYISLTGNNLIYSGAVINLHYDYYTIDNVNRQIYTRESYTGNQYIIIN